MMEERLNMMTSWLLSKKLATILKRPNLIRTNSCIFVKYEDIKIHSLNLIELIEVGDYVNGFLIDYIDLYCKVPFLRSERPYREATTWYKDLIEKGKDYNMCLHFKQEDIKSIVTKEQFSRAKYVF